MALIVDALPGIAEKIPGGQVLVTSLDWLLNWSRANSLWPLSFGTKCCAIEMLMATGASHQARLCWRMRSNTWMSSNCPST